MRKLLMFLMITTLVALMFVSCEKEDDFFDQALLTGIWQSGTLFERYFANGNGYTWDTSDDVKEDEAQNFTWTLINTELTQIHIMEMGGNPVPRFYTVTELSPTRLRYRDNFGKSYSFTRVDD